eukprot:scaffold68710_cov69-Phaeocystis_antarctica.AAC.4
MRRHVLSTTRAAQPVGGNAHGHSPVWHVHGHVCKRTWPARGTLPRPRRPHNKRTPTVWYSVAYRTTR